MATITTGAGISMVVLEPLTVLDYAYTRASRNIVHEPLGSEYPIVFLRPAQSRSGTLSLLFGDAAGAREAGEALAGAARFHFEAPALGEDWQFIVTGNAVVSRVEGGVPHWTVNVEVREVEPL